MARGKRKRDVGTTVAGRNVHQQSLADLRVLPQLKKPTAAAGEEVLVLGSYWTRCAQSDKEKNYICIVREFDALHSWPGPGQTEADKSVDKSAGMQLQLMGEEGGATLDGGEVFWMKYPHPFLQYWYAAHPLEGAAGGGEAEESTTARNSAIELDGDGLTNEETSAVPQEKSRRTKVLQFVKMGKTTTAENGKMKGKKRTMATCCVRMKAVDGRTKICGKSMVLWGMSTSRIFGHLREAAEEPAHARSLAFANGTSCRQVKTADGSFVPVFSFKEAFKHHVDFVWMVASRTPQNLKDKEAFRDYIKGFEPRATFPHHETIHRIADCIDELQQEQQNKFLKEIQNEFKRQPCIGLQLDMWTDTLTHTCYASISMTHLQVDKKDGSPQEIYRLLDQILAFETFPKTEHTGVNIKDWIISVLERRGIHQSAITGITPDGASDGQTALDLMGVSSLVDTCYLHQLQRALLYSLGLAGTATTQRNAAAKELLMKHRRIVQLHNQSNHVAEAIRKKQAELKIPSHKVLTPQQTHAIRWGSQARQVSRNILLKPLWEPIIHDFKARNRDNPDKVVCVGEEEGSDGKLAPRPIKSKEIGLTGIEWETSRALDSFLDHALQTKDRIESCKQLTTAQAYLLLVDFYLTCKETGDAVVQVKKFPISASVEHRKWTYESTCVSDLPTLVQRARTVLVEEMEQRFFSEEYECRASDHRLVHLYMSKQTAPSVVIRNPMLLDRAKTLYLSMLRKAAKIAGIGERISPRKQPPPKRRSAAASSGVLRSSLLMQSAVGGTSAGADAGGRQLDEEAATAADEGDDSCSTDPLQVEIIEWSLLQGKRLAKFVDQKTQLLDEFKMMAALSKQFPIHAILFRQMVPHLSHEANVESTFAHAGGLSDPNMNCAFLGVLVRISGRKKFHKPSTTSIFARYQKKYHNNSDAGQPGLLDEDDDLDLPSDYECAEEKSEDEDCDNCDNSDEEELADELGNEPQSASDAESADD